MQGDLQEKYKNNFFLVSKNVQNIFKHVKDRNLFNSILITTLFSDNVKNEKVFPLINITNLSRRNDLIQQFYVKSAISENETITLTLSKQKNSFLLVSKWATYHGIGIKKLHFIAITVFKVLPETLFKKVTRAIIMKCFPGWIGIQLFLNQVVEPKSISKWYWNWQINPRD